MNKDLPVITFIGKPNNGKSSMISALTMDDRIKISMDIGTTLAANEYIYSYQNDTICKFFDTPGFEQAPELINFIEDNQNKNHGKLDLFRLFMEEKKDDKSYKKDLEILKAILESNVIVFVVNISEEFDEHNFGYELEIINFIKNNDNMKSIKICFNKINDNDYSDLWIENLLNYKEDIIYFNPLNSKSKNIKQFYKDLDSKNMYSEKIINTYTKHLNENIKVTIKKVIDGLIEILQIKVNSSKDEKQLKIKEMEFFNKINKEEKKIEQEINKIWGYHRVKIINEREDIRSKNSLVLGMSKKTKTLLYTSAGATIGATITGILSGGFGAPAGGGIGGAAGVLFAYISNVSIFTVNISLFKKEATYSINKKDFDFTRIQIVRLLSYIDIIINHGHANRKEITIDNDSFKVYDLSINDEKEIKKIHESFTCDNKIVDNKEKLAKILKKILKSEILIDN